MRAGAADSSGPRHGGDQPQGTATAFLDANLQARRAGPGAQLRGEGGGLARLARAKREHDPSVLVIDRLEALRAHLGHGLGHGVEEPTKSDALPWPAATRSSVSARLICSGGSTSTALSPKLWR